MNKLFSNEIVFKGHPDKVCDQIAGAILDAYLIRDPETRAGIEVTGGKGKIFITGEVTTCAKVNIKKIVHKVLRSCGYPTNYKIIDNLGVQSKDIARGVDVGGAGDQGVMFGYAVNDTAELLPTAMVILQKFAKGYEELRKQYSNTFFADGKAQITGEYDEDMHLIKIRTFLVSYNNSENRRQWSDNLITKLIRRCCIECKCQYPDRILINPTGKFLIGGFEGDAGVCGRKIVVDAYQGFANVGGGNMNGKDPTKVDMSAAHMARKLACEYLSKYNLRWCEVQLAYAIGLAQPVSIRIDSDKGLIDPNPMDYRRCEPSRIIDELRLRSPNYEKLAQFGHFTGVESGYYEH